MNLLNIRLYGHEWEPAYFRNKGVRGWWLRALNALRYWLELKVQWHTLYILSKVAGADLDAMRQQFEADTHKVQDRWREGRGAANLALASQAELFASPEKTAEQRTVEMLERLSELTRARRYGHSRRVFSVFEVPDEDHYAKAGTDAGAVAAAPAAARQSAEVAGSGA